MDVHLAETYYTVAHIHILTVVLFLILVIIPLWAIFRKAGFSGALSLLMVIPVVNIIVLYVVGFSRRPSHMS